MPTESVDFSSVRTPLVSASPVEVAVGGVRPVALITGATRGIGRAVADVLAVDHHLLIGGTDPQRTADVASSYASAEAWPGDLTDSAALAEACAHIGRLDLLVHSAGVADGGRIEDTGTEVWDRVFRVNVFAVAELTRLVLPQLRAGGGQVVMINSGAGLQAGPGGATYAASKFALRALADALREEERGSVRVTSIHPGRVDTDMQVALQQRQGRPYDRGEHLSRGAVAAAVRAAVDASPEAMIESLTIRPVRNRLT